jgi:hypothetical protein
MTIAETARALSVESEDYIYRLLRTGALAGRKVDGRWDVDEASVRARAQRVALKRSSKLSAAAERDRRREAARAAFAPKGGVVA